MPCENFSKEAKREVYERFMPLHRAIIMGLRVNVSYEPRRPLKVLSRLLTP